MTCTTRASHHFSDEPPKKPFRPFEPIINYPSSIFHFHRIRRHGSMETVLDFNGACFGLQWSLFWTSMEPVLKRNGGSFAVQNRLR